MILKEEKLLFKLEVLFDPAWISSGVQNEKLVSNLYISRVCSFRFVLTYVLVLVVVFSKRVLSLWGKEGRKLEL